MPKSKTNYKECDALNYTVKVTKKKKISYEQFLNTTLVKVCTVFQLIIHSSVNIIANAINFVFRSVWKHIEKKNLEHFDWNSHTIYALTN